LRGPDAATWLRFLIDALDHIPEDAIEVSDRDEGDRVITSPEHDPFR
jgi:hypothetical protein